MRSRSRRTQVLVHDASSRSHAGSPYGAVRACDPSGICGCLCMFLPLLSSSIYGPHIASSSVLSSRPMVPHSPHVFVFVSMSVSSIMSLIITIPHHHHTHGQGHACIIISIIISNFLFVLICIHFRTGGGTASASYTVYITHHPSVVVNRIRICITIGLPYIYIPPSPHSSSHFHQGFSSEYGLPFFALSF